MKFGERLRELRNEKGLTQKELGEIVNVNQTSVKDWELGKNETDFTMLCKLAEFFDVTAGYLLGMED